MDSSSSSSLSLIDKQLEEFFQNSKSYDIFQKNSEDRSLKGLTSDYVLIGRKENGEKMRSKDPLEKKFNMQTSDSESDAYLRDLQRKIDSPSFNSFGKKFSDLKIILNSISCKILNSNIFNWIVN